MNLILKQSIICLFLLLTPAFGGNTGVSSEKSHQKVSSLKPFIFIRHGETDYNAKGLFQGVTDIPLNEIGRIQSIKAAKTLKGMGIKKIVSSPLSRTVETAEIIRKELNLREPIEIVNDLRDRNWGELQGTPIKEHRGAFDVNYQPKGGESLTAFEARTMKAFQEILNKGEEGILIVAHGSTYIALLHSIGDPFNPIKNTIPVHFTPPTDCATHWKVEPIPL